MTNALTARGGQEHQALLKWGMIADTAGWQTVRQYHCGWDLQTNLLAELTPLRVVELFGAHLWTPD